jgi:hypothetical protein
MTVIFFDTRTPQHVALERGDQDKDMITQACWKLEMVALQVFVDH